MRKIFITLAMGLFLTLGTLNAQTRIKTNALYWAFLAPNVSVETKMADNWTLEGGIMATYWKSLFRGKPFKWGEILVGTRYYTKKEFEGFYLGPFVAADVFIMSKYNYSRDKVQNGVGIALGLTVGYQWKISERWNIDCYIGGGWHHAWYWGENRDTGEMYIGWNKSGEWMPYRGAVSFSYRLFK